MREHISTYGLDWYFAVAPIEVTRSLIDEFGNSIIFAPGTPVVLVCEDGSARQITGGVTSAEGLQKEVEKGC